MPTPPPPDLAAGRVAYWNARRTARLPGSLVPVAIAVDEAMGRQAEGEDSGPVLDRLVRELNSHLHAEYGDARTGTVAGDA